MKKEKLEKIQKRIDKDWSTFVQPFNLDKDDAIRDAYRIAHANEIEDFFYNIDEEYPPFDEFVFDNMLKYKGNIIEKIWEDWLRYIHPERYNFFNYEDLCDIIIWSFK